MRNTEQEGPLNESGHSKATQLCLKQDCKQKGPICATTCTTYVTVSRSIATIVVKTIVSPVVTAGKIIP